MTDNPNPAEQSSTGLTRSTPSTAPTPPVFRFDGHAHIPSPDAGQRSHMAQFYESPQTLEASVAAFLGDALRDGRPGALIGTSRRREGVERLLQASGVDTADAMARGLYVSEDAGSTMDAIMVNGMPDRERFHAAIGEMLEPLGRFPGQPHVFGEMVALLVERGNYAAALSLEHLWNELQESRPFALLCAYPMDHGGGKAITEMFESIIAAHTHVAPAESFTGLTSRDDQLREIALLQQKALWLEREIGERKHAEERLRFALASEQAARQETETALRMRDEFLSIAAHELKTPLTGLTGHVQLAQRMLDQPDNPVAEERVRRSLTVVSEQTRKLTRLLEQLLDTSRLEAGRLTIEKAPLDLADLTRQASDMARIVAGRRSIVADTPSDLPMHGDALRLEQALSNLLDNAIRHTPDGGRIDVTLTRLGDGRARLAVRDRGPGIPPEHRERVFDRYYRLHENGSSNGLGLGLNMSREIVELHGGSIHLECPPDGGSTFVMVLPCEVVAD